MNEPELPSESEEPTQRVSDPDEGTPQAQRLTRVIQAIRPRLKWQNVSPIISLIALVVAALTLKYTLDSGREMGHLLSQLNASFSSTGKRLEALPQTVTRFDSTVNRMAEVAISQENVLTTALDTLTSNLRGFSVSLDDYKSEIDDLVEASDRQLAILKTRQELLEKELGRRSDLVMAFGVTETDSGFWQVRPRVINQGDAPTSFFAFFFDLPQSVEFQGTSALTADRSDSAIVHVSYTRNEPMGFTTSETLKSIRWTSPGTSFVLRKPPMTGTLPLRYSILYEHADSTETIVLRLNN